MKGVRFYFDYGAPRIKRRGGDAPNALAILVGNGRNGVLWDAIGALTEAPNAPVCGTQVDPGYLRGSCKRVSQGDAYRVHPNLRRRMETVTALR